MRLPFIILVILAGGVAYWMNGMYFNESLVLYGFAETKETEINMNHALHIETIHIAPGQAVTAGQVLLEGSRLDRSLDLDESEIELKRLTALSKANLSEVRSDLKVLEVKNRAVLNELEADLRQVKKEIAFQNKLYSDLSSISSESSGLQNLRIRKEKLEQSIVDIKAVYAQEKNNLETALKQNISQTLLAQKKIAAQSSHREKVKRIPIAIRAPSNGLIGNVYVKEGEHISDFNRLISFYEPHPSIVKAYVMEEQLINVGLGDMFTITSAHDPENTCTAPVSALGSRIIEIPPRMLKMPALKNFGREVIFQLPDQNQFLQNEKLILQHNTQ